MSTDDVKYYRTSAFKAKQKAAYAQLEAEGFYDIESGLDSPPMLKPHQTTLQEEPRRLGGDTWLDSFTEQPYHMGAGKERYSHFATLVAAQEYELCRLGPFRRASEVRASWALHAQGISERDIARALGIYRCVVEDYVAELHDIVVEAVANDEES